MAKAGNVLSRRFQGNGGGGSGTVAGGGGPHVHEYACEMKNASCVQANVTPIRSMSMREKRLAELENGTNSLPRTYAGAGRCTTCTYCSTVANTCSPCCLSTPPMNVCPNYYVKVTFHYFSFLVPALRLIMAAKGADRVRKLSPRSGRWWTCVLARVRKLFGLRKRRPVTRCVLAHWRHSFGWWLMFVLSLRSKVVVQKVEETYKVLREWREM